MNNSNRLLDLYRQKLSLRTNQAVADKLGVKQPTVSMWINEKSHPNAEAVAIMCKATGEKLAHWLPLIEADRSRTQGDRNAWLKLAQAAAALAGIYLMIRHGLDDQTASAFALSPVYIMRNAAFVLLLLIAAAVAANYRGNNARSME
jgi:transcriptional regulator with XRE-family HTH domain